MFEGSLVESRGLAVSRVQRWSAVGSAAVQMMVAALVVVIPLLRPQMLKILAVAPHLTTLPLPVRPAEVVRTATSSATSSEPNAPSMPSLSSSGARFFPLISGMPVEDGTPMPIGPITMGPGGPMPGFGAGNSSPTVTVARAAERGPMEVSRGVSEGLLLSPIRPAYPQIAVLTKTQGTVVVEAVISKAGKIESAHAVSGPPMLRQAALDAVTAARYRPYLLSGEPVEVQTTVTVVFRLGE